MTSPEKTRFSHWRHWTALLVLTCLLCLSGLSQFPVIDRDEARFAQASVQMAESGDLINIRFQDEARNKNLRVSIGYRQGRLKRLAQQISATYGYSVYRLF